MMRRRWIDNDNDRGARIEGRPAFAEQRYARELVAKTEQAYGNVEIHKTDSHISTRTMFLLTVESRFIEERRTKEFMVSTLNFEL
jgi:hypothetical protein